MKPLTMTLAAALVATLMAAPPALAAAATGNDAACRPEAGDNRTTGVTSQDTTNCAFPNCVLQISAIAQNSATVSLDIAHDHTFGGQYRVSPSTPKRVDVAVMGNDAKSGTVVWGHQIGELSGGTGVLSGSRTFTGLKPDAHYVALVYAPYVGYSNLNPFATFCFRTAPAPWAPHPFNTGCAADPRGYATCAAERQACTDGGGTWSNSNRTCTN